MPPRKADMVYLRILKQAALGLETDVTQVLALLLDSKTTWDDNTVAELLQRPAQWIIPDLIPQVVNLSIYDQLLQPEACYATN
jgi:hypothetical protein